MIPIICLLFQISPESESFDNLKAVWLQCFFKFPIVQPRDEASLVVMGEEAYMVGGIGQSSVEVTIMMLIRMLMRMVMVTKL